MSNEDDVRVAALCRDYLKAEYLWEKDGRWNAIEIGQTAPSVEAAFPEEDQFGMLWAWNPQSIPQSDTANRAADEALQIALMTYHVPHRPCFATGANRSWREPGWLVIGLPVSTFDVLARRFRQLGTLHWQRGQPVRLRMYATMPAVCAECADVDWLE